jgi:hypothetical protein
LARSAAGWWWSAVNPPREVVAVAAASGAQAVFTSADESAFPRRRARRIAEGCAAHGSSTEPSRL